MPARFNGRTKSKNSSGSGMDENSPHLGLQLLLWPVGMLVAQPGSFHPACRPVKLLGEREAALRCHAPIDLNLLRTRLFVGQHKTIMRALDYRCKVRSAGFPTWLIPN